MTLRREHAKGVARHWSYDINRHIAIKKLYDRLIEAMAGRRYPLSRSR
jgi:hypothetical protein